MNQSGRTHRLSSFFSRPGLYAALLLLAAGFSACEKWKDATPPDNPALNKPYCNDPEAVNYNWDFPGRPDSTACIYPSDVFLGTYSYRDSLYRIDGSFDSAGSQITYLLTFHRLDRKRLAVTGWCGGTDSIHLTANRYFKSSADTTASVGTGQLFCRVLDTLSGSVSHKYPGNDSFLLVNFQVVSDTGTIMHRGTAVKQ